MIDWIFAHWIELVGAVTGFIYIFFEIKAKIWMWPVGIVTSAFYILVFLNSKFYADMSLQVYYLVISIYGWIYWMRGSNKQTKKLPVSRMSKKLALILLLVTIIIFVVYVVVLKKYTDSPLPYWDSFTTALSITATWMLAKKIIEQWIIWIIVDIVSMGLYIYKDLYPTSVLFLFFGILSVIGYRQWQKIIRQEKLELQKSL